MSYDELFPSPYGEIDLSTIDREELIGLREEKCFRPLTGKLISQQLHIYAQRRRVSRVSVPLRGNWSLNSTSFSHISSLNDDCFRPLTGKLISQLYTHKLQYTRYPSSFRPLTGKLISQLRPCGLSVDAAWKEVLRLKSQTIAILSVFMPQSLLKARCDAYRLKTDLWG